MQTLNPEPCAYRAAEEAGAGGGVVGVYQQRLQGAARHQLLRRQARESEHAVSTGKRGCVCRPASSICNRWPLVATTHQPNED